MLKEYVVMENVHATLIGKESNVINFNHLNVLTIVIKGVNANLENAYAILDLKGKLTNNFSFTCEKA